VKARSVKVAAPSKTPQPSGPHAKSDRLDCRRLVDLFAKEELTCVALPTETQEADRQVMRARGQCLGKVKRAKQQIKSFLLQHGIAEPEGLAHWSNASLRALRDLKLNAQLRFCLDRLLEELDYLRGELKAFEEHLDRLARSARLRKSIRTLETHPGIGPLTAMAFAVEVFSPERFTQGKGIAGFLQKPYRLHLLVLAGLGQLRDPHRPAFALLDTSRRPQRHQHHYRYHCCCFRRKQRPDQPRQVRRSFRVYAYPSPSKVDRYCPNEFCERRLSHKNGVSAGFSLLGTSRRSPPSVFFEAVTDSSRSRLSRPAAGFPR